MSFGKAIGWSLTAAASGILIAAYGMKVTAIVASSAAGVLFLVFVLFLEREGERKLPWSNGKTASKRQKALSFSTVFSGVNKALWTRTSIIVMLVMLTDGLISGFGHALMPIAAVNLFAYTTAQWSQLVAVMGLIGAVVSLSLGPMIDRFGVKTILDIDYLIGWHARSHHRSNPVSLAGHHLCASHVEIEDTCIDRCVSCSGLWFDEGEIEALSNKKTAALIDTGEASIGKAHNVIDQYPCPRCGGSMDKKVDSQQRHIWYETCVDCNGSFFDAGEFLDLSQLTISGIFKRLVTPKRN